MNLFAFPILGCALIFTLTGVRYFMRSRREPSKPLRQASGMIGALAFLAAAQLYALSVPEIYRAVRSIEFSVPFQKPAQKAPSNYRYQIENVA